MNKITNTDKWVDSWFSKLRPTDKLVFIFLCENCDDAGFYELDYPLMETLLGMQKKEIIACLGEIKKCFIPNITKKKIWLRKHLYYQKALPLDMTNDEHSRLRFNLMQNIEDFNTPDEMNFIIDETRNSTTKQTKQKKSTFQKPSIDDWREYHIEIGCSDESKIIELYDYYESCGWKVGSKPMMDWKASIRNVIRKNDAQKKPKTRLPEIQDASRNFLNKEIKL